MRFDAIVDQYWIHVQISTIIILWLVGVKVIRWLLNRSMKTASQDARVDATRYRFLKNAVSALVSLIAISAIIYTVPAWRAFAITLFAGAGVLIAIVGFAGQMAFANIISGVFIVIFRPFRVHDRIQLKDGTFGEVVDITLRHTVIQDFQNRHIVVPNATMSSETIVNLDIGDARICQFFEIGISYDSDVERAIQIIKEEAENHSLTIDARKESEKDEGAPLVKVRVVSYGDSSVNLRAWCWTRNFDDAREINWKLNKIVKARFDAEGIEIPFPHRTIVYKDKQNV